MKEGINSRRTAERSAGTGLSEQIGTYHENGSIDLLSLEIATWTIGLPCISVRLGVSPPNLFLLRLGWNRSGYYCFANKGTRSGFSKQRHPFVGKHVANYSLSGCADRHTWNCPHYYQMWAPRYTRQIASIFPPIGKAVMEEPEQYMEKHLTLRKAISYYDPLPLLFMLHGWDRLPKFCAGFMPPISSRSTFSSLHTYSWG